MSTNHTFTPDTETPNKCSVCKRGENTHGICECCPNTDTLVRYKTFLMCRECYDKDKQLSLESEANADKRVAEMNATLKENHAIESAIKVRTDLFNAATISIAELKSAIDSDETIPGDKKDYKLAETLVERFNHFKKLTFDLQEQLVSSANNQKAIQIQLNDLANKLRSEERERLRLQDINYKPAPVAVTKIKSLGNPTKKKFSMSDIKKAAEAGNVPLSVVQALVIAQNMTPEAAVNIIKAKMAEKN